MGTKVHPIGVNSVISSPPGEEADRANSTPSASLPARQAGLPHALPQDAKKNSKRFTVRFRIPLSSFQSASNPKAEKKPVSNIKIGTPQIRENTALKTIREPAPEELIADVESFRQSSLAKNNSGAMADWDGFASKHPHLAAEADALKERLAGIDARMNSAVNELRLTVYEDIRNASERLTPQYEAKAKAETPKPWKERRAFGKTATDMRAARTQVRAAMVKKEVDKDVQAAIGRFKQRVRDDFEPERPKDIREACLKSLIAHFGSAAPAGPLAELVAQISPEALKKFHEMQGGEQGRPAKGAPPPPPPRWSKKHLADVGVPKDKQQTPSVETSAQRTSAKGPPPSPPPRWSTRYKADAGVPKNKQ
jgi:hypothetical protein